MKVRVLVLVLGLVFSCSGLAGVGSSMKRAFDEMGAMYPVTGHNYYVMQKAFHGCSMFHGGSVVFRTPSGTIKPVDFNPPRFSYGAGEVDLDYGGFSYITEAEMSGILKAGAMSSSFISALKMVTPTIEGLMSRINDWRIKYLNQSMNEPNLSGMELAKGGGDD